eukprot:749861-Hanusia_phi.AAC.1
MQRDADIEALVEIHHITLNSPVVAQADLLCTLHPKVQAAKLFVDTDHLHVGKEESKEKPHVSPPATEVYQLEFASPSYRAEQQRRHSSEDAHQLLSFPQPPALGQMVCGVDEGRKTLPAATDEQGGGSVVGAVPQPQLLVEVMHIRKDVGRHGDPRAEEVDQSLRLGVLD